MVDSTSFSRIKTVYIFILVLFFLSISSVPFVVAENISINSGHIYSAVLHSSISSDSWAGIVVVHNSSTLEESSSPFLSASLGTNTIIQSTFPGVNLNDGVHFYLASLISSFDASNLLNISSSDLHENSLFDSAHFSVFYPQYNDTLDNPENTFCCTQTQLFINGREITVFDIVLEDSVHYYLGKYNDSGNMTPVFISPIRNETCFNSSACVSEFLLPENTLDYNFFAVSENRSVVQSTHHGRSHPEVVDDKGVFDLNLSLPSILEVRQGSLASIIFKVKNIGSIPSFHYIVGPVLRYQWEFSYRDVVAPLYPEAERVGRFFIILQDSTPLGDYDIPVTVFDPDNKFVGRFSFTLRVIPKDNSSVVLNVSQFSFYDIPQIGVPIGVSFLISNPSNNSLSDIIARSSDSCIRRVEGIHSLAGGETSLLDFDITFSRLPCDATIEFYSGDSLLGFANINSSAIHRDSPGSLQFPKNSFFKISFFILWATALFFAFKYVFYKDLF